MKFKSISFFIGCDFRVKWCTLVLYAISDNQNVFHGFYECGFVKGIYFAIFLKDSRIYDFFNLVFLKGFIEFVDLIKILILKFLSSRYSHRPQSRGGPRSVYSVASTAKTGRSGRSQRLRGARIEAMSAPNPFCPNPKGVCCLMLLINLGLILVTLGFVIVIQFFEPLFVW